LVKQASSTDIKTDVNQALAEKLAQSANLIKATYSLAQLERFKPLAERSRRQPIAPDSAEGKARASALVQQQMSVAQRQIQRLKQDPEVFQQWISRVEQAITDPSIKKQLDGFRNKLLSKDQQGLGMIRDYLTLAEVLR
jgi:uncharacterized protein (DUF1501 family)